MDGAGGNRASRHGGNSHAQAQHFDRVRSGDRHGGQYQRGKRSGPAIFYQSDGRVYDLSLQLPDGAGRV